MSTRVSAKRLVDFLSKLSAFSDQAHRSTLLEGLPNEPVTSLARYQAPRADLHSIVEAALSMGRLSDPEEEGLAIVIVLENVRPFVRGLQYERELDELQRLMQ